MDLYQQNLNLNAAEQRQLESIMQQKMHKDIMIFINGLTQTCFNLCIKDTTTRELSVKERKCISNCFSRVRNSTERLTMRFQQQAQIALEKKQKEEAANNHSQPTEINYLTGQYY